MFIFMIRNWFETICVRRQNNKLMVERQRQLNDLYHSVY